MTANEIRKKFLDFFESKGHTIVASDSVVPKDDPTVLFTTAGMQQFKRQFLGQIDGYTRAATSQKCLRTDDLDKVGKTPFHHTFFEMLGNFSFGDYFKKEAIAWAWEFLTKELKIDKEKLWVSVYQDDDEAYNIWKNDIKIPPAKILKLGDKDNFWPAEAKQKGPNGPCGPCSEIFFDYGVNPDCKSKTCDPTCNCGRFSEVWNLVFTQFNRKDGGVLEPLPGKNIDTGMGLERLVAVMQGKRSNYDTDLFQPILSEIIKFRIGGDTLIILDHIRAIVFGISDGVMPSNKGRGYVIKKLINECTDLALHKGAKQPIIYKLVASTIENMRDPYPELVIKRRDIEEIIWKVEEDFIKIREKVVPETIDRIQRIQKGDFAEQEYYERIGEICFEAYDTYGLTAPTIQKIVSDIIGKEYLSTVMNKFTDLKKAQQERSRAGSKMTGDVFASADLNLSNVPKTQFLGYGGDFEGKGTILKLFSGNKEVNEARKSDTVKIILDKTPFYAESGGQIGDTGTITKSGARIRIEDTQKIADVFIHSGHVEEGSFRVSDTVQAVIDKERRLSIMRNHTATHLLQAALRKVLGSHVQQQGSLVAEDRLRFDFTHPKAITKEELAKIESLINGQIHAGDKVETKTMDLKEAKESGAMAFFAEKYKDVVRVVSVGNYSKELCGGTHLKSTGEIEAFKIVGEGAVAQGIRRIEARTAAAALHFSREREKEEEQRTQLQNKRLKELEEKKKTDREFLEYLKNSIGGIIKDAETIHKTKVVTHAFPDSDTNQLKQASDLIKQQVSSVAICIGSTSNGSASLVVGVSSDLIEKGVKANELIKNIAPLINGSGGGRPELAQAGSKDGSKLKSAIDQAREILKKAVSK